MSADHFSSVAGHYAAARPDYPAALFDWLQARCARQGLAWDVGAGSGQATVPLAARFARVHATDLSAAQLAGAPRLANVDYLAAPAHASGLPDASVDLVTVAQALHWFEPAPFHAEVRRVLRPGGLIAAWTYAPARADDARVEAALQACYRESMPWWPPGREHIEDGYARIDFPWPRLAPPAFTIERDWTLAQLLGYVRSWSASARCLAATGTDLAAGLARALQPCWQAEGSARRMRWQITLLAGTAHGGVA